jgi:hypothetical protein
MFIGSPSICILPDGSYVASYDENSTTQVSSNNTTQIYRSIDKGKSWSHASTISGQFWSTLFVHNNNLYIIGPSKVAGNLIIRRSTDGGTSWTTPTGKSTGIILSGNYHTAPTPVTVFKGRIWRAVEDASLSGQNDWTKNIFHQLMFVSISEDLDLLNGNNWVSSNALGYDETYLSGKFIGWLEGNAIFGPDEKMHNVARVEVPSGNPEYMALLDVSDDGKKLTFDAENGFHEMIGGSKKFTIRYDTTSNKYYTLANYNYPEFSNLTPTKVRNCLVLMSSYNLEEWKVNKILLRHSDVQNVGFQYVDWQFEGNDIIYVSRTSYPDRFGGASNYHNANYLSFHRIID